MKDSGLAQLMALAPVAPNNSFSKNPPQSMKVTEKEFSGVLAHEESRIDDYNDDAVASQADPSQSPFDDSKADTKNVDDDLESNSSGKADVNDSIEKKDENLESRDDDESDVLANGENVLVEALADKDDKKTLKGINRAEKLAEIDADQIVVPKVSENKATQVVQTEVLSKSVLGGSGIVSDKVVSPQAELLNESKGLKGKGKKNESVDLLNQQADKSGMGTKKNETEPVAKKNAVNLIKDQVENRPISQVENILKAVGVDTETEKSQKGTEKVAGDSNLVVGAAKISNNGDLVAENNLQKSFSADELNSDSQSTLAANEKSNKNLISSGKKIDLSEIDLEPVKAAAVKIKDVKIGSELVKPESVKPGSVKPELVKPEAVKSEDVKTEPEPVKAAAVKIKDVKIGSESVKPEAVKSEDVKTEPEPVKAAVVKIEDVKIGSESVKPEAVIPENIKTEPSRMGLFQDKGIKIGLSETTNLEIKSNLEKLDLSKSLGIGQGKTETPEIITSSSVAPVVNEPLVAKNLIDKTRQKNKVEKLAGKRAPISVDVEINIEDESVVSDEKLEKRAKFFSSETTEKFNKNSATATAHLQGRARENQTSIIQNESGKKDFSKLKNNQRKNVKTAFTEELKSSIAESQISASSESTKNKDQALLESATSKNRSETMTLINSESSSHSLLNKSANTMMSSKSLPISDQHLIDQIQAGLTQQANGRKTLTIKLWPEHLGRVDVKMVMHKQNLTAIFTVESPEVKDAMMRKIDALRDSLSLKGIDSKGIEIKVTPAKSGDGPSLMSSNQQQNSNSAWKQFSQGNMANNNFASKRGWGDNLNDEQLLSGSEVLESVVASSMDHGIDPGSLHITA